jgi:hypothetical protein
MLVISNVAGALAIAYAGTVLAVYTGRLKLCAAAAALVIGAMVYFSFWT